MSKKSTIKIKDDDKKIIQELKNDARQSSNEIAKKCGFSRQKVWRTIMDLEKENNIWGYTAIVDEKTENEIIYFALVKSKLSYISNAERSIKNMKNNNSIKIGVNLLGLNYVNGMYDWIIMFSAKDILTAKKYCGYMQKEYGELIEDISLLENVFTLSKYGKLNPNLEKLKEFSYD